jgi:hypothetical protein
MMKSVLVVFGASSGCGALTARELAGLAMVLGCMPVTRSFPWGRTKGVTS